MEDCNSAPIHSADFGKRSLFIYSPLKDSDVLPAIKNKDFSRVSKLTTDKNSSCSKKLIDYICNEMQPGSIFLIEDPHMQPRKKNSKTPSKAQPWTEEEAADIIQTCEDNDVVLKYVPGKQSPRNRATAGVHEVDKCDEIDAMCINYFYVKNRDKIGQLKNPPRLDVPEDERFAVSKKRLESYEYKKETDAIMNNLRFMDYDVPMCEWIAEHLEPLRACLDDEEARSIFELSEDYRKGKKKLHFYSYNENHGSTKKLIGKTQACLDYIVSQNGKRVERKEVKDVTGCSDSSFKTLERYGILTHEEMVHNGYLIGKLNAISAILSTLMTEDCQLRVREYTQARPGLEYVTRYVLRMSPYHHKGGVARSNLYWHTLKNYIIREGKEAGFDFQRKITETISVKGKTKEFPIRRGHFTEAEDNFYLAKRKVFRNAVRKLWQKMRNLIDEDPNLSYPEPQVVEVMCQSEMTIEESKLVAV